MAFGAYEKSSEKFRIHGDIEKTNHMNRTVENRCKDVKEKISATYHVPSSSTNVDRNFCGSATAGTVILSSLILRPCFKM